MIHFIFQFKFVLLRQLREIICRKILTEKEAPEKQPEEGAEQTPEKESKKVRFIWYDCTEKPEETTGEELGLYMSGAKKQ